MNRRIFIYILILLGVVFLIFPTLLVILYLFIMQPFQMVGNSMIPSVTNNQYFIGSKVAPSNLQRGDIIVLRNPHNPTEQFVKRVIALSDDKIKIDQGKVFINDQELVEPYLGKDVKTRPGMF